MQRVAAGKVVLLVLSLVEPLADHPCSRLYAVRCDVSTVLLADDCGCLAVATRCSLVAILELQAGHGIGGGGPDPI
jgi:hypothetical protein